MLNCCLGECFAETGKHNTAPLCVNICIMDCLENTSAPPTEQKKRVDPEFSAGF